MHDKTEGIRRTLVNAINMAVQSDSEEAERERLEKIYDGVQHKGVTRVLYSRRIYGSLYCCNTEK